MSSDLTPEQEISTERREDPPVDSPIVPDYSDKPAAVAKAKKPEKSKPAPPPPAPPPPPGATGLSYRQLARLISAAIETTDPELKAYAKIVLMRELGPLS